MMKLHCQAGNHDWERPAQRGRPPLNCPEHAKAKPVRQKNLPAVESMAVNPHERMARLRDIKAQRQQERVALEREADAQQRAARVAELPALMAQYEEAFDADNFDLSARLQAKIIHAARLSRGSGTVPTVIPTADAPVDITDLVIERMCQEN